MNPLLILPLLWLQEPQPAPAAVAPAVDARTLFSAWVERLESAPVVHLVADGVWLTREKEHPDKSVRWEFHTEVWMAKGGRVQARTKWTGPRPEVGEPESFTSMMFADGKHSWQGIEGPAALHESTLASPRCVPYPLPEVFGFFDRAPQAVLPATALGESFDWGEPKRSMPTVVVLDPEEPKDEPAFWYGFGTRDLAGWCTMLPERLGGDVLRARIRTLDLLERLPEEDPPRFEPEHR